MEPTCGSTYRPIEGQGPKIMPPLLQPGHKNSWAHKINFSQSFYKMSFAVVFYFNWSCQDKDLKKTFTKCLEE